MANKLIFDNEKMLAVARIVKRFNEYVYDDTVETIVARMECVAHETFHTAKQGYVGTGGFVLSAYNLALRDGGEDAIYIYPSVSDVILDKAIVSKSESVA
jgi:hypothetical protein